MAKRANIKDRELLEFKVYAKGDILEQIKAKNYHQKYLNQHKDISYFIWEKT